MTLRVGIIGAGIAGLTIASRLTEAGHSALVLDKGRGVGGRASNRRGDFGSFDHGVQYFTARDLDFREFLRKRVAPGSMAAWDGRFASLEGGRLVPVTPDEPRMVGVPGMGGLARSIAEELEVRTGAKVIGLAGAPGAWSAVLEGGEVVGPFDWLVVTAPPAQSAALLGDLSPIAGEVARVAMRPCFSLMLVPAGGATLPADGIRCDHAVLGWAAVDGSKPGRSSSDALVIQSSHDWAEAHVNDDLDSVAPALKAAASEAFDVDFGEAAFESVHRWLYARPVEVLGRPCLVDAEARLAASGDWCVAAKLEGAYRSGDAFARAILDASNRRGMP